MTDCTVNGTASSASRTADTRSKAGDGSGRSMPRQTTPLGIPIPVNLPFHIRGVRLARKYGLNRAEQRGIWNPRGW